MSFTLTGVADYGNVTYLTAYQAGITRPATSTPLGTDRAVDLYNHVNYPDAVIDVFGYFAPRQ